MASPVKKAEFVLGGDAAVLGAALAGARTIIAVDVDDRKLEWARQFGATHTALSVQQAGTCDVLLEFSGSSPALQDGVRELDVQGVAVLAGSVATASAVTVVASECLMRTMVCSVLTRGPLFRGLTEQPSRASWTAARPVTRGSVN